MFMHSDESIDALEREQRKQQKEFSQTILEMMISCINTKDAIKMYRDELEKNKQNLSVEIYSRISLLLDQQERKIGGKK